MTWQVVYGPNKTDAAHHSTCGDSNSANKGRMRAEARLTGSVQVDKNARRQTGCKTMNSETAGRNRETFVVVGSSTDQINVKISHRIIKLFSEGLYSSPNKAVEELVSNSFDAGACNVHIILSPDLHDPDATISVIDDGEGMDADGLKQHWVIGESV